MPADPPVVVAQISDFHVAAPGRIVYGIDPAKGVERCIAQLNALDPRPALVVVTGDIAETGSVEEYEHAKRLLSALEIPYVVTAGNHDAREPMRRVFSEQSYAWGSGSLDTFVSVGGIDVVVLDSSVAGQAHGALATQTLDWLAIVLSADLGRPTLVFLHHPPVSTGIQAMDRMNLHNADDLAELLMRHPRVRLVASGHVHRCVSTTFAGTRATICPSVNHAVALDLAERFPLSYTHEPPGFQLHCWIAETGVVVTHTVPIGSFDKHPF